ncbi:aldehyde dehydrogenase [Meredithblackwellia eburnea MCA 4105]
MSTLEYTNIDDIKGFHSTIQATFRSGKTRDIEWRKKQLNQLGFMVQDNEDAFCKALTADLGRPSFETVVGELQPVKGEINEAYSHVASWSKPRKVKTSMVWALASATVTPQPKGIALVIGTWNYPITLTLGPLIGAIAAGCPAIIKPAEQNPATATLLATLIPKYLDTSAYIVVNGAVDQATALLKLRYDHIFYTGSGNVGKIIAKAAAEHLTPVTLELGGKSPACVFDDANIEVVARRIMWGKWANSGQICISPDYIMCTKSMQPKLIAAFEKVLKSFSGGKDLTTNDDFSKIVSPVHFERLSKLLNATDGEVAIGGKTNKENNKIEVTIVKDVKKGDGLLQGEIFGPILPIMVVEDKDEMINYINDHDNPLALYVFTQSKANRDYIFNNTRSGTFVQNDVVIQFTVQGLPFGGAGQSGYGNYHGKHSFDTFSHERASAAVPTWMEVALASRYPPYTPEKLKMLLMATKQVIKRQPSAGRRLFKYFFSLAAVLAGIAVAARRGLPKL